MILKATATEWRELPAIDHRQTHDCEALHPPVLRSATFTPDDDLVLWDVTFSLT